MQPWMQGETFTFEGATILLSDAPIQPGDLYIAGRNTGPHILTCLAVGDGYIHAVEAAYSFDSCECRKIVGIA